MSTLAYCYTAITVIRHKVIRDYIFAARKRRAVGLIFLRARSSALSNKNVNPDRYNTEP
jgi:hypothetical protein